MNKKIHMTYKNSSFPMKKVFGRWTSLNPMWKIEFSEDSDCINFINEHFGNDYVNLFNYIKSGPNKADLWRLCKLYIEGGLYADIDIIPLESIENIIEDSDLCTCLGIDKRSVFQAFLFVKEPYNPIIKRCIESLLENKFNFKWDNNEPTLDMYNIIKKLTKDPITVGSYETIIEPENIPIKMKILEEYMVNSRWQDCMVRDNNTDVLKSRDIGYHEHKFKFKTWK